MIALGCLVGEETKGKKVMTYLFSCLIVKKGKRKERIMHIKLHKYLPKRDITKQRYQISALADISGSFRARRNIKFQPILRVFHNPAMTAPQSGRYGGVLALCHGPPSAIDNTVTKRQFELRKRVFLLGPPNIFPSLLTFTGLQIAEEFSSYALSFFRPTFPLVFVVPN